MNNISKDEIWLNFGHDFSYGSLEACLTRAYRDLPRNEKEEIAGGRIHFDLSNVRFVYIDSLLFFLCVLNQLKNYGTSIKLSLPERNGRWDYEDATKESEEGKVRRVRDFLKRWHFDYALNEAVYNYEDILPARQLSYFVKPQHCKFYHERFGKDQYGEVVSLLSCLMVEITHLTRGPVGLKVVSEDKIEGFINNFSLRDRFEDAVFMALGRPKDEMSDVAKEFATTILLETLMNTEEHPNASLSMVAISRVKQNKRLIIAVADNGLVIPKTIAKEFDNDQENKDEIEAIKVSEADRQVISLAEKNKNRVEQAIKQYKYDAAASVYATKYGTTGKRGIPHKRQYIRYKKDKQGIVLLKDRGLGLHYVKEKTLDFGGTMTIRTGYARTSISASNGDVNVKTAAVAPWSGNLVSVILPIAK